MNPTVNCWNQLKGILRGRERQKEKKDNFDWDSLRIQAQAKVGKREKTESTMDSLDWDAVRRADVSEIADAIRERGMNNMLAECIKTVQSFLNLLVDKHESIDLEWLRDVPPDQAKVETKEKAEAEKILQLKKAESVAESKYLVGLGNIAVSQVKDATVAVKDIASQVKDDLALVQGKAAAAAAAKGAVSQVKNAPVQGNAVAKGAPSLVRNFRD